MSDPSWKQWATAATSPSVDDALSDLHRRLSEEIAAKGATCWSSGKCCNFDAYGHRMYVTGLEIAWFMQKVESHPVFDEPPATALPILSNSGSAGLAERGTCPYQHDKRCTVHEIRPLGCRVFFCQEGTQDWQQVVYERYLDELRALHTAEGLPYHYMDWIDGLNAAAQADRPDGE